MKQITITKADDCKGCVHLFKSCEEEFCELRKIERIDTLRAGKSMVCDNYLSEKERLDEFNHCGQPMVVIDLYDVADTFEVELRCRNPKCRKKMTYGEYTHRNLRVDFIDWINKNTERR